MKDLTKTVILNMPETKILSHQFFPVHQSTPEEKFLWGILDAALDRYLGGLKKYYTREGKRKAQEEYVWFMSDSYTESAVSFLYICDHLKINPQYFRRGLIRQPEEYRVHVPNPHGIYHFESHPQVQLPASASL